MEGPVATVEECEFQSDEKRLSGLGGASCINHRLGRGPGGLKGGGRI